MKTCINCAYHTEMVSTKQEYVSICKYYHIRLKIENLNIADTCTSYWDCTNPADFSKEEMLEAIRISAIACSYNKMDYATKQIPILAHIYNKLKKDWIK